MFAHAGSRRTYGPAVLDRLQPHQFEQRQKHTHQRLPRFDVAHSICFNRMGRSSSASRRRKYSIICPTVTVSSSTLIIGRLRARSRICWKVLTRSMTSAAISGSVPSASMNSLSAGFDNHRVFDLLLLHQHLRRRLELFMLDQAIDQLCSADHLERRQPPQDREATAFST